MNRLTKLSSNKNLFIIITEFMGDYKSDFLSDIRNLLDNQGYDYWTWNFKGYSRENAVLGSLSELIFQTKKELEIIQTLFPEKKFYFITHSQGAYVISRVFSDLNISYPTIMLTPAFDLSDIILQRLDGDEEERIQIEGKILKTFRNGQSRILTKKWYQEYKDISFDINIPPNKLISIWGKQDYIVGDKDKVILDRLLKNDDIYLDGDHTFSGNSRDKVILELDKSIKSLI